MTITIISVGTKPGREMNLLMQDYVKRLPKHVTIQWRFIDHASGNPKNSVTQESEAIMRILTNGQKTILLDETGYIISSPELAKRVYATGEDCTFIIGGAYGVSEQLKQRADFIWSLSNLVFPHQIVRLLLVEQLYRAYAIHIGHPYHHA